MQTMMNNTEICNQINNIVQNLIDDSDELVKITNSEDFICDGNCERDFKEIFNDGDDLLKINNIIICTKCNEQSLFKKALTYIDRRESSIEEKPRRWPCIFCHKKMGGG